MSSKVCDLRVGLSKRIKRGKGELRERDLNVNLVYDMEQNISRCGKRWPLTPLGSRAAYCTRVPAPVGEGRSVWAAGLCATSKL